VRPDAPEEIVAKRIPPSGDSDWHPEILGWSGGIHEFYGKMAVEFASDAKFVELGVYKGRGILWLACKLRELGKLDVQLVGIDDGVYYDSHGELMRNVAAVTDGWGERPAVEIRRMRGRDAAPSYPNGSLDCVFIDADHSADAVYQDIVTWLPKVKQGGVLAGHDYAHVDCPGVKVGVDRFFGQGRVTLDPDTIWRVRVGA